MAAFENQSGGKTISLLSKEGECFEIPREVCQLSNLLAGMLQEDDDADEVQELPLPNVSAPILSKIVDFMLAFHQEPMRKLNKPLESEHLSELVQESYAAFIDLPHETLFNLTLAANYMDIQALLDLCSAKIASCIRGKTPEQIRANFCIVNDFSPDEEAQVREENKWSDEL